MFRWCAGAAVLLACAAAPAGAGGGGPVSITGVRGSVLIREVDFHTGQARGPWRLARKGNLIGSYLLKTADGSWAHLHLPFSLRRAGKWVPAPDGCVDSRSVVRIHSYADSTVEVLR